MSGRDNTDAKAKAIAEVKKELVIVIVGLVIAAAVVLIGGSGALRVLRWVIALLVLVLVVAARVLRRRRSRKDDATPAFMQECLETRGGALQGHAEGAGNVLKLKQHQVQLQRSCDPGRRRDLACLLDGSRLALCGSKGWQRAGLDATQVPGVIA